MNHFYGIFKAKLYECFVDKTHVSIILKRDINGRNTFTTNIHRIYFMLNRYHTIKLTVYARKSKNLYLQN